MKIEHYLADLKECFQNLRRHNMKLNPTKCTFDLRVGKFLGYMVSRIWIEANLQKISAILDMQPPKNFKEVQRLTGKLIALRRFMAKSA